MRFVATLTLLTAWLTLPALAQEQTDDRRADRPRDREARRSDRRGDRGGHLGGMVRRLPDQLELDDQQRAQFEQIVADHRQRMGEGRQDHQQFRELFQELREAREAGDEARVEELRAELRDSRRGAGGMMDGFLNDVEGILREDQIETLSELRRRWSERMDRTRRPGERLEDLRERLKLDPEQQAQFDDLLAAQRERGQQRRQEMEDLRPLVQELREALRAGDDERVAELRAKLDQRRSQGGRGLDTFFAELLQILNDDQKPILAEFREEMGAGDWRGEGRPGRGADADLRTILQVVRRLELTTEQREKVSNIAREATRTERKLGRRDREARAELAAKVKKEITAVLDSKQAKQFEQSLERGDRRDRPGRDSDRERRRGRRRDRPSEDDPR